MITSEGMVTLQPEETEMERGKENDQSECVWKQITAGKRCVTYASHSSMQDVIFRYASMLKASGPLVLCANLQVRSNACSNTSDCYQYICS